MMATERVVKMLRVVALLLAAGCISATRFSITAPNVFHIGDKEPVTISVFDAIKPVNVKLYLQDYPHRQKTFSQVQGRVIKGRSRSLSVKVEQEDLPDLSLVDKQFVYLVAKSDDAHCQFHKEAKIRLSYKDGMVFIQANKTIYTPRQNDDAAMGNILRQTLGAPCPNGWTRFKTYCYLVSSSIMTWHAAQAYCQAKEGELVKINSAEENEFVLELARKNAPSVKQVWVGLKWDTNANQFVWYDRSFPVYTNWAPREPNGNAGEPCVHMYTWTMPFRSGLPYPEIGYWNDLTCELRPFYHCGLVCKRLP